MARRPKGDDESATRLKRVEAGSYRTEDGRFTVEQAGSGWMLIDAERSNELGLPLVLGPFGTLDVAREALAEARAGRGPAAGLQKARPVAAADGPRREEEPAPSPQRRRRRTPAAPAKPDVVIRELRVADGPTLRKLWTDAGFRSVGDDDISLARLLKRNPGLVLVAVEGRQIVASALGAWDGRRGWIYHVATASTHRRQGIATRLVRQIEDGLAALGCRKVNVLVREGNQDGAGFWSEIGYEPGAARMFGRELPTS